MGKRSAGQRVARTLFAEEQTLFCLYALQMGKPVRQARFVALHHAGPGRTGLASAAWFAAPQRHGAVPRQVRRPCPASS